MSVLSRLLGKSWPRPEYAEPGGFTVVLQVPGPHLVPVIKLVRQATGHGLLQAKQLVDDHPSVVASGLSEVSAGNLVAHLQAAGARATVAQVEGR
jgi:large subunit ribosomal protein L7/L12